MESWVYLFSKFTHEALLFEALILFLAFGAYAAFYITQKRKYGVAAGNELPSNVVQAYLAQLMIDAEDMRVQLFGLLGRDTSPTTSAQTALKSSVTGYSPTPALPVGNFQDSEKLAELEAKMTEQSKALDSLLDEKKRLEEELNRALTQAKAITPVSTAVTQEGVPAEDPILVEKVKTLEAQLAEYAIIEDDLANLKRLQKENKTLRAQLESIVEAPPAAETVPTAELAAASIPAIENQESSKADETNFESLINDVEKSLAQDATSGETTSEKSKAEAQNKSEAELQADFEKMLNS